MNSSQATASGRPQIGLYAMAMLGIHIGFMPLLVLLLPRRIETLFGEDAPTNLSILLIIGAISASLMHIVAGHWSDRCLVRFGDRRRPIFVGLIALTASYALIALAGSLAFLIAGILAFQVGLNLAFAPLGALLADYFSDEEKGRIAGLMNAALPLSSAAVAAIAWLQPQDGNTGFLLTCLLFLALIVPLLAFWPFGSPRPSKTGTVDDEAPLEKKNARRDFVLAWTARALVQTGAAFVLGYLYIFVSGSFGTGDASGRVGQLSLLAAIVAFTAAIISGRISDHLRLRRLPLAFAALLAAGGLFILSGPEEWVFFCLAYALFHVGLTAFLSIDTALVAQLVSASPRRGTLLGIMNLTNTVPAVIAPASALLVLEQGAAVPMLAAIFAASAFAAVVASVLVLLITSVR